jgi:uncharacterized protein DUF5662
MDSTAETQTHIERVQQLLGEAITDLLIRSMRHDASKLKAPEKAMFDAFTPRLNSTAYDSEKYQDNLAEMGDPLQHHYRANRHHPEHFSNGIADMSLLDVLEMLADWKAATERREDSDLEASIEQNAERFQYGEEFAGLLMNTARDLGWL